VSLRSINARTSLKSALALGCSRTAIAVRWRPASWRFLSRSMPAFRPSQVLSLAWAGSHLEADDFLVREVATTRGTYPRHHGRVASSGWSVQDSVGSCTAGLFKSLPRSTVQSLQPGCALAKAAETGARAVRPAWASE
jgi:hypothetical protein